jgi:hypothetical protein
MRVGVRLTVVSCCPAIYELLHGLRSSPSPLRRLPTWGWNTILKHFGHTPTMARKLSSHRWGARRIAPSATQAGMVAAKVIHTLCLPSTSRRALVDAGGLNPDCDELVPQAALEKSRSIARCRLCSARLLPPVCDRASVLVVTSYPAPAGVLHPPRAAVGNV